ncbi:MAG: hypothetical protein IJZ92_04145 [Bacteroidaceae bacterium]|nr:hypothetical protein [Bacteroidaceae bacterium]
MKKLSILFVAFFIISISLKAQEEVGTYYNNYFKEEFTIEASQKNNKISDIYIEVSAKKSSQSFINIGGDDLETFKASLIALRDKYLSWVKIAKDNNVTEMNKEFDIKFPSVTVAWVGSKWWFDFNRKISMRFLILESGKMVAVWAPKVTASSNEYIDETIYFTFECEDDFNNLLDKLNSQVMLDKLQNRQNKEDLFQ